MDWAAKQLNIKEMSDWYNVSVKVRIQLDFQVENKGFERYWWSLSYRTI
jgi:hypothetical protein